jgi:hypothetical protein
MHVPHFSILPLLTSHGSSKLKPNSCTICKCRLDSVYHGHEQEMRQKFFNRQQMHHPAPPHALLATTWPAPKSQATPLEGRPLSLPAHNPSPIFPTQASLNWPHFRKKALCNTTPADADVAGPALQPHITTLPNSQAPLQRCTLRPCPLPLLLATKTAAALLPLPTLPLLPLWLCCGCNELRCTCAGSSAALSPGNDLLLAMPVSRASCSWSCPLPRIHTVHLCGVCTNSAATATLALQAVAAALIQLLLLLSPVIL